MGANKCDAALFLDIKEVFDKTTNKEFRVLTERPDGQLCMETISDSSMVQQGCFSSDVSILTTSYQNNLDGEYSLVATEARFKSDETTYQYKLFKGDKLVAKLVPNCKDAQAFGVDVKSIRMMADAVQWTLGKQMDIFAQTWMFGFRQAENLSEEEYSPRYMGLSHNGRKDVGLLITGALVAAWGFAVRLASMAAGTFVVLPAVLEKDVAGEHVPPDS